MSFNTDNHILRDLQDLLLQAQEQSRSLPYSPLPKKTTTILDHTCIIAGRNLAFVTNILLGATVLLPYLKVHIYLLLQYCRIENGS